MSEKIFKGVGASPGVTVGPVVLLSRRSLLPVAKSELVPEVEWERFNHGVSRLEMRMAEMQDSIPTAFSDETLEIFSVYKALVEDPSICASVRRLVFEEGCTADWAVYRAFQEALDVVARVPHGHIAEKGDDIETVRDLLLEVLMGKTSGESSSFAGSIVVAARLTPRDMLDLGRAGVVGVVSETGTRTSHVAILARNLGIPAVFGVGDCCAQVSAGEKAVLDGTRGLFEVSPTEDHLTVFQVKNQVWQRYGEEVLERAFDPVTTLEGVPLEVLGNMESKGELPALLGRGARGVGLFRLEFFYLARSSEPSEEDLVSEISDICRSLPDGELVVRLLDAGGDKEIPSLGIGCDGEGRGSNPAMGLRGIRILLKQREILSAQIRAILRANQHHGNVSLLVPFVSCIEEMRVVRALLREEWRRMSTLLDAAPSLPRLGMMVEVPSAVAAIDLFAREVDFFSIGTNDLTQHLLGVDRTDEGVATLFDSLHPALIRCLRLVFDEADARQIPVTLCGEMAADPLSLELLVGLGLRSFSVNTRAIPFVKDILREISLAEAKALATEVRILRTAQEVRGRLQARFIEKFGLERYAMVCDS